MRKYKPSLHEHASNRAQAHKPSLHGHASNHAQVALADCKAEEERSKWDMLASQLRRHNNIPELPLQPTPQIPAAMTATLLPPGLQGLGMAAAAPAGGFIGGLPASAPGFSVQAVAMPTAVAQQPAMNPPLGQQVERRLGGRGVRCMALLLSWQGVPAGRAHGGVGAFVGGWPLNENVVCLG